jgi:hypothetical protein
MSRSPKFGRRAEARPIARRRGSRRLILVAETFESRELLSTIIWSNMGSTMSDADNFNATYGADAAAARTIVQTAILAWEQVVQDFNYANVGTIGNAPTANTYTLNVSATDLGGGGRGDALVTGFDSQDKPFSADIRLDDDGGNTSWYFDPNPDDNAEFTSLLNRFTSTFTTGTGNDFYRTIVHEIGHAMGISLQNGLAIVTGGFLTPGGTDQNDAAETLQVFTGATSTATFTSNGGGHIYEGPADPAFPGDPLSPFDLMNPGRTIGPPPTRELITDLNAAILRDAYGYTVATPSTIQTFLANFNTTTGELTINGDVLTDAANVQTFIDDAITIDRQGVDLRVDVDGVVARFPFASVTSWQALGTGGGDQITIDFAGGSPVPAGGASVDGGPPSTLPGDSLTFVNQGFNSPVVFTPSTTGPTNPGNAGIGGDAVSFVRIETVSFASPILDFTYATPPGADVLTIDSPGPGLNRITGTSDGATLLPFTLPNITNLVIDAGIDDDAITLESPGLVAADVRNFTVDAGAGDDTLIVRAGADFALPVAGGAFTYNAGAQATPGGDDLLVHAPGASTGQFRPDGATVGSGRFLEDGTTLFTTGLERATVDGFADFALVAPNDGDAMTITPSAGFMNRIVGSSGGVAFSALSFYDVTDFLIDSRSNNVGGLLGDHYTIDNPGGPALQADGLRNFTIRSSAGNDSLTIRAADFRLPLSGGEFLLDAGTGAGPGSNLRGLISLDRIVVEADVDFLLTETGAPWADLTHVGGLLSIAAAGSGQAGSALLGSLRMIGVEGASLTGGPSGNRADGSGFSGTLFLAGGAGDDTLIGGSGDNELVAGAGDDLMIVGPDAFAAPGLGSQNHVVLRGGGTNVLRGGPGRNTFRVDLNGTSTLIGGPDFNFFDIINPPDGVVDPVGGIEVVGNGPDDVLRLVGGGGAGYNQTYLLGPAPGAGNIVTTNNHVPDGPTISQFIRFRGIEAIGDTIVAAKLVLLGESPAAPIGGITGADLAAGLLNPTVGGLPFGRIAFENKSAPSVQLADGQVVKPPAPLPLSPAPLMLADPAPAAAVIPIAAIVPAPIAAASAVDPAPIAEVPARPGFARSFARRLAVGRSLATRRLPRPASPRPEFAHRAAFGKVATKPFAFRPVAFAPRGPLIHLRHA